MLWGKASVLASRALMAARLSSARLAESPREETKEARCVQSSSSSRAMAVSQQWFTHAIMTMHGPCYPRQLKLGSHAQSAPLPDPGCKTRRASHPKAILCKCVTSTKWDASAVPDIILLRSITIDLGGCIHKTHLCICLLCRPGSREWHHTLRR